MPLSDIVTVNILATSPGLAVAGFGKPLILGGYGKTWAERYREYASLTAVADDFRVDEPEYLQAQAIFAQNPAPALVGIGRGSNPPTMRWAITPSAVNETAYTITIGGQAATYTSDDTALVGEIVAGLVAAINALAPAWTVSTAYSLGDRVKNNDLWYECITAGTSAGSGGPSGYGSDITDGTAHWAYVGAAFTASDQTTYVRVVCDAAGQWQSLTANSRQIMTIAQDNAAPALSTDLNTIKNENDTWYCLLHPWASAATIEALATWAEANEKMYVAATQDTECATVAAASATDVAKTLSDGGYECTNLWYHPENGDFLDGGIAGKCLPLSPGSETWKFKRPATVTVTYLTPTEKANLDAKSCNYYYDAGGVTLTGEGVACSGEWIDVVRAKDALRSEIQTNVVNTLTDTAVSKVPYTDGGILAVKGAVQTALRKYENSGFLIADESTVTAPRAADVSAGDRAARVLNNVTWTAKYTSAIHKVISINGVITY